MKTNFFTLSVLFTSIIFSSQQQASGQEWLTAGNNLVGGEKLGSLNSQPVNIVTNNTSRIYVTPIGRVGIGTTSPVNILTVKSGGGTPAAIWVPGGQNPIFFGFSEVVNADLNLATASTNYNQRPVFLGKRSRGTLAAPTKVADNDFLTSLLASGYDGSAFQNPATIDFFVDGAPSAGNVPARISFVTGSNSTNRLERLKIGSTGNFDFNAGQLTLQQLTGNVGIGTGNLNFTNSLQTIQFPAVTTTPNNAMINMFSSGTQNVDRMVIAHSPAYTNWGLQYQDELDKFNFLSGGTPVFTTDLGSWRVGVGTSSPATRFDILGTGAYDLASSEGDFRLGDGTYRLKMGVANAGGGAGDAYIASSNRLFLGAGSTLARTQTVSINSDGRVGVGTFLPTAKLQVVGEKETTIPVIQSTVSYVGSSDVRGITSFSKPADGWGYGVEGTGGFIGGYFAGSAGAYTGTGFGVYGTASGTAGTRIGVYGTASGGTANNWGGYFPTKTYTSELRVGGEKGATGYVAAINGKLIATEVRVELIANWPDYVFRKGYKLMSLEELEAKIKSESHLPGIPSASEVKENGIMVGEMQTKTMEKVEENTLYILQLNNKIKELERIIDELSKKIK